MRILGVDPGLTRCGLGVIDVDRQRNLQLIYVGVAETPASSGTPARLVAIADAIDEVMEEHQPEAVAIERVFAQHNVRSVMGTAQASGLVMVAAERRGLPVALHTPSEVKAAVTGNGRAAKKQVGSMVQRLLGLAQPPAPADAADALAIAICHAWRGVGTAAPEAEKTAAQRRWDEAERAARRRT